MTNINLKSSDYLAISRAIDTNNNNLIDNDEASLSFKAKTSKDFNSVAKFADSLAKGDVVVNSLSKKSSDNIADYFSDRSSNTNKILTRWNKNSVISKEDLTIPNKMLEFMDINDDSEISTSEFSDAINSGTITVGKSISLNHKYENIPAPNRMEEKFGLETTNLIKRFDKNPIAPYPKPYACDTKIAVIEHTSIIDDLECSEIYSKKPYEIAKEVFEIPQVKNDLELKAKISTFMSLLADNDKAALASIKNIFTRKPSIANNDLKAIFDKLSTMLTTNYDSRVGTSKELVISALHDVAMPTNISQERIGTCTGTSVQIQMAMRNPVEYLKMLDNLAKNQSYTTLSGNKVPPNFTFTEEGIGTNANTGRTISSKIMQNAIMDYGDENTRDFSSANNDGGLNYSQTVKALKEIVNVDVESSWIWDYTPNQLLDITKKSKPSWSNPVEMALSYERGGRDSRHSVNVVDITDSQVTIVNPWGRTETFPTEQLKTRILSVSNPIGVDKGTEKFKISSSEIKNKLADNNTKDEILKKMSVGQKFELMQELTARWTNGKYVLVNTINENDKKIVLNILDELLQGGEAQNSDWYPRLKFMASDKNELLQKLETDSPNYLSVKAKLSNPMFK